MAGKRKSYVEDNYDFVNAYLEDSKRRGQDVSEDLSAVQRYQNAKQNPPHKSKQYNPKLEGRFQARRNETDIDSMTRDEVRSEHSDNSMIKNLLFGGTTERDNNYKYADKWADSAKADRGVGEMIQVAKQRGLTPKKRK